MSDEYTVGNEDGLSPALVLVRDAIAREVYAQIGLRNEVIQQEDIPGVAYAITVMLDRMRVIDHCPALDAPADTRISGHLALK